eukprot:CAMPEP_0201558722 /NCGR_PEP_ID=MMETSP0173_2-20130828/69583_1 /ASSEMBLY_ACC=CAM_ASM_000268 /TAXON_ID=218659 /ORGANISM="Vexillifera sp., Strain DIVA3 564/2" /LENGTH=40 /DNA_ID= /DNA_START= /DNA_END= /DNA_ORIENTATION=
MAKKDGPTPVEKLTKVVVKMQTETHITPEAQTITIPTQMG